MVANVAAMVYHIWRSRNDAYWNQRVCNVNSLVYRIQKHVIDIIYSVLPRKVTCDAKELLRRLAIHFCS